MFGPTISMTWTRKIKCMIELCCIIELTLSIPGKSSNSWAYRYNVVDNVVLVSKIN